MCKLHSLPATTLRGSIDYIRIELDECLETVKTLNRANKKWHSHVLSPVCAHNPFDGDYAIVIEDEGKGINYIATSREFPEVDKDLVKMLHGDDVLDPAKSIAHRDDFAHSRFLQKLVAIETRGAGWHHHMHFPSCALSLSKGRWAISVEASDGEVFSESFDDEPLELLREVEIIYFRNLDRVQGKIAT